MTGMKILKQTLSRGFSLFILFEEYIPKRYPSSHKQKTPRMCKSDIKRSYIIVYLI
tara:strand:- start:1673 stop:1840 length:168 start_codon:yes stop_codon:yes gene_type:complete